MQRRQLLAALGAGTVGLAGCTGAGGSDGGGSGGDTDTGGSDGGTSSDGGDGGSDGGGSGDGGDGAWSLPDHPSLADVGAQGTEPWLGPLPGEAPALVVAFEDPSCILCRRFEEGTFPKLESKLLASGSATFVYRTYPIVYEWGKPATQALAATLAAEGGASGSGGGDAFWKLKDHYYAEQDAFDTGNVLDRTESFLASETDLDAAAVVAAAREKRHDDRVQADLAAGESAGVGSTPTFFLFREGSFRTTVTGAQSYQVFATALGF